MPSPWEHEGAFWVGPACCLYRWDLLPCLSTCRRDQSVQAVPRSTDEYKRRIAIETEACTQPGEIGASLRREGPSMDQKLGVSRT